MGYRNKATVITIIIIIIVTIIQTNIELTHDKKNV